MKKIIICSLIMLFSVGCTNQQGVNKEELKLQMEKTNTISSLSIEGYIILDIASHDNKLIILYSAHENTKVASAKLVIVDDQSYNILNEIEDDSIYTSAEIVALKNGFYVNQGNNIKIYNYNLKILKQIDMAKLQRGESGYFSGPIFSLSDDLKLATYINQETNALVVYDFDTNKEKEIYKLSDKKGNIMSFDQLYLKNNLVGFSGKYIYDDNFEIAGSNAYGRVDIATGKIDIFKKNETTSQYFDGYILIVDLLRFEDKDRGTGETIIYDIKNNIENIVSLDQSYSSFDVNILEENLIVSYNDVGRDKSKLIIYQEGKSKVLENVIPNNILNVGTCFIKQNGKLLVYYTVPKGESIKEEIKSVKLK